MVWGSGVATGWCRNVGAKGCETDANSLPSQKAPHYTTRWRRAGAGALRGAGGVLALVRVRRWRRAGAGALRGAGGVHVTRQMRY